MIIPYHVDVPYDRKPFLNWLIVAGMIFVYVIEMMIITQRKAEIRPPWEHTVKKQQPHSPSEDTKPPGLERQPADEGLEAPDEKTNENANDNIDISKWKEQLREYQRQILGPIDQFVLHGWNIKGLFGHMWLHGNLWHLAGNMLFLWLFGNAVCSKIGNLVYMPLFVFLGLMAAFSHLIFSGGAAIGASGAINGVVGMFLVFFPENEITCVWVWWFFTVYVKQFSVSSYWMIAMWFVFDALGAIFAGRQGGGGVAYFAHLGGLAGGVTIAIVMLKTNWITMERYEKSILELIGLEKKPTADTFSESAFWQQQAELAEKAAAAQPPVNASTPGPEPEPIFIEPIPTEEFIRFYCGCGKKIKVPGIYAGKKAQCPACSAKLEIPAASQEKSPAMSIKPTAAADSELIRFTCACGKRIKVPAHHAGRTGTCPRCKSQVKIPEKPMV